MSDEQNEQLVDEHSDDERERDEQRERLPLVVPYATGFMDVPPNVRTVRAIRNRRRVIE
jgi:hypothetical protein